ncbi:MAG TPA: RusA family crossover junction endodeoxyribonuclease [Kineosporiaceae bacterium]|nr:RusA family crossover junction endodeoxyribonuclease [Kineosporiaceae bacterium]
MRRLRDGSTKRVPVLEEESAKVEPWRQAVSGSFRARVGSAWVPLDGPVVLDVVFTVRRPTGAPKTRRVRPDRSPDLDKLLRATCDGLTEGGLWVDDGRLVAFRRLEELYAGDEDPDALTSSGAVIRAWLAPVTTIGGRS